MFTIIKRFRWITRGEKTVAQKRKNIFCEWEDVVWPDGEKIQFNMSQKMRLFTSFENGEVIAQAKFFNNPDEGVRGVKWIY